MVLRSVSLLLKGIADRLEELNGLLVDILRATKREMVILITENELSAHY